jgi:DnaK suppressor protein
MKSTTEIDPKWEWHYQALLQIRDSLLRERREHEEAVRDPHEPGGEDAVDRANEKCDNTTLIAEIRLEDAELTEVEAALGRIRKGTYGICELTGRPIPAARLRALPWARLSRDAAEQIAKQA